MHSIFRPFFNKLYKHDETYARIRPKVFRTEIFAVPQPLNKQSSRAKNIFFN